MDKRITKFIQKHELLSFCVRENDGVYTASAFYVFDEQNLAFLIASNPQSLHILLAKISPKIALNIAKKSKIALLQGIQARALFEKASKEQEKIYYSKFPFAKFEKTHEIYALKITWLKFTDNALNLGKKLEFSRN